MVCGEPLILVRSAVFYVVFRWGRKIVNFEILKLFFKFWVKKWAEVLKALKFQGNLTPIFV